MGATCRLLLTASATASPLHHCSRCSGFPLSPLRGLWLGPTACKSKLGVTWVSPCVAGWNSSQREQEDNVILFLGIMRSRDSSRVSNWKLSYWRHFPKKVGGEKQYCTDEIITTERNNCEVGSGGGGSPLLSSCLCSFSAEKKVKQT